MTAVVVIVGASSGIGRASAHQFAQRGMRLVLAARNEPRLETVEQECRNLGAAEVLVVAADVCRSNDVQAMLDRALEAYGRVDVLVHAAAVMAYGTIENVPVDVFDRVVDTTIHGTANVARAVLPVMRAQDHGTFIVVSSLLASIPVPNMGAYIASKWGQLALARILQLETRDAPGVNVCTVAPGAVDTPIYRAAANFVGRIGRPPPPVDDAEKVATAIVRLADRPRKTVSVGRANRFIVLGFRLLPGVFDRIVTPLFEHGALSKDQVAPGAGNVFAPISTQSFVVEV
jgi:short-subunit dehydrogenase